MWHSGSPIFVPLWLCVSSESTISDELLGVCVMRFSWTFSSHSLNNFYSIVFLVCNLFCQLEGRLAAPTVPVLILFLVSNFLIAIFHFATCFDFFCFLTSKLWLLCLLFRTFIKFITLVLGCWWCCLQQTVSVLLVMLSGSSPTWFKIGCWMTIFRSSIFLTRWCTV